MTSWTLARRAKRLNPSVAVECPTYPGARGARFLYLLPNDQNPTGRCLPAARRMALAA